MALDNGFWLCYHSYSTLTIEYDEIASGQSKLEFEPRELKMHYHVNGGLHGCIPNVSCKFDELKDAKECFNHFVEEEFDLFNLPDYKVRYNKELDYAEINGGGNEYYEIVPCEEVHCIDGD